MPPKFEKVSKGLERTPVLFCSKPSALTAILWYELV